MRASLAICSGPRVLIRRMLATRAAASCARCGWTPQPRSWRCDSTTKRIRILEGTDQPTPSDGFVFIDKPPGIVVQSKYPSDDSVERQLRALLSLRADATIHFPHRLDKHAQVPFAAIGRVVGSLNGCHAGQGLLAVALDPSTSAWLSKELVNKRWLKRRVATPRPLARSLACSLLPSCAFDGQPFVRPATGTGCSPTCAPASRRCAPCATPRSTAPCSCSPTSCESMCGYAAASAQTL